MPTEQVYDAIIVGAGAGGVTAIGNVYDQGWRRIAWIDPTFDGGRLKEKYLEVPR